MLCNIVTVFSLRDTNFRYSYNIVIILWISKILLQRMERIDSLTKKQNTIKKELSPIFCLYGCQCYIYTIVKFQAITFYMSNFLFRKLFGSPSWKYAISKNHCICTNSCLRLQIYIETQKSHSTTSMVFQRNSA